MLANDGASGTYPDLPAESVSAAVARLCTVVVGSVVTAPSRAMSAASEALCSCHWTVSRWPLRISGASLVLHDRMATSSDPQVGWMSVPMGWSENICTRSARRSGHSVPYRCTSGPVLMSGMVSEPLYALSPAGSMSAPRRR